MKKIKMIVTSVTVLAIVGSALAFNAQKIGVFCVTGGTANVGCYVISNSMRTTGFGTPLLYIPNWTGQGPCTTGSGCNTLATFVHN